MGDTDWAIVVGIQAYPGLTNLGGPRNDAEAFCEWLVSKEGGAVLPGHVKRVITPPNKQFRSPDSARPTDDQVRMQAEAIQAEADKALQRTGKKYVGRRLYLYFAGHGFSPRSRAALLMANSTKRRVGSSYHWLGDYTAEWFWQAGYFDEILLFMDCCREIYDIEGLNIPWLPEFAPDFKERVKRFYAFATGWTLLTREVPDDNGTVRGVFTRALLEGLRGRGAEPNSDRVTTRSLQKYLTDSIPALRDSDFVTDDFTIATVPGVQAVFAVRIVIPARAVGHTIELWDSTQLLQTTQVSEPGVWEVSLGKGLYSVVIPTLDEGQERLFRVKGIVGEGDVEL